MIKRKPLVKYQCLDCLKEFVAQEYPLEIERHMSCPFCKREVEPVSGADPDAQELYDDMGCLYPGGAS